MSDASTIRPRPTGKAALWLLVVAALALVIGANAHLVYVALTSQPACVAHLRPGDAAPPGAFSAARSACTPARAGTAEEPRK